MTKRNITDEGTEGKRNRETESELDMYCIEQVDACVSNCFIRSTEKTYSKWKRRRINLKEGRVACKLELMENN